MKLLLFLLLLGIQQTIAPPAPVPLPGQPTPSAPGASTGAISGVVTDGSTKAPIADALVYLSLQGRGTVGSQSRQLTDPKGRFAFVGVPAGTLYAISTSKLGYLDGGFTADNLPRGPGGSMGLIAVRDGQWVSDVRVTMWKPGAIGGTVTDERGEAVAGVFVRVLSRVRIQGRDELASGPIATTDDRGSYRVSGLAPGRYIVQVPSVHSAAAPGAAINPSEAALDLDADAQLIVGRYPIPPPPVDGRRLAYPATFHPGAAALTQAAVVDLKFGDERTDIDVKLDPVPTFRVAGRVDAPAEALKNLTLRLLPAGLENLGQGSEVATGLVGGDGRFVFLNVPAGSYTLDAPRTVTELTTGNPSVTPRSGSGFPSYPGRSGWSRNSQTLDSASPGTSIATTDFRGDESGYSGRAPLVVSGSDVSDVTLVLRRMGTVSGRVELDADPSRPANTPSRFSVQLDPADGNPGVGMPRSVFQQQDNTPEFFVQGVPPGRYFLRPTAFTGWVVKSVRWNGRDYVDSPLDTSAGDISGIVVTVTNAVATLAGVVREQDGTIAQGATIVLFPADRAQWNNYGFLPLRIRTMVSTNSGAYRIANLAAGEYYVISVPASQAGTWRDADFFQAAERLATRVSLSWGRDANQDLTVSAVR